MKNVFKKSTTVLLALTFILAISNLNGVNTSFADTEDNTTQTTTEQSNSDDSTTSDDSATDDSTTTEESTQDSEKDENTLTTKDGFKYILEEDEVTIKGYEGKESDLEIPSEIDGHKVTKIGENAFDGNEEIINVTIPDSVTSIGEGAFANCTALNTINLPSKIKTISYGIFASCSNLTKIEIPSKVTSIDGYAFYACTSLKDVNIPEGVTSIGEAAFYYCVGLENLELSKNVTEIGDYAFENCTNLTITGYNNTKVKTYATENSIPFKTIYTAWDYIKIILGLVLTAGIIFLIYKLRAIIKNKRYLKNNIVFDEPVVILDNQDCKIEIKGKSNKKIIDGKEINAKKNSSVADFVGYVYEIENKSKSPIQVSTKYITIGEYTDKFNLNEEIPAGKKAKGFTYCKKINSLSELKEVSGIVVISKNNDDINETKEYNFNID